MPASDLNEINKMPPLIYGTAWKKERTADLVALALSKGFRAVDTACQPRHYSEDLVGEGLKRSYNSSLKRQDMKFPKYSLPFCANIT